VLPDQTPSAVRLRGFLKRALRSFGVRCLSITPVECLAGETFSEPHADCPGAGTIPDPPGEE
jgi:hypothetical protein